MMRVFGLFYGAGAYLAFLATILWAMGFVGNIGVAKTVDVGGPATSFGLALLINAGVLSLFVIQHTIMARPAFKRWLTQYIPAALERSTFVWAACAMLALAMWQWRPMGGAVWHITDPGLRWLLHALAAIGWGIVFYSSFLIDHFDLFGLRQVWLNFRGLPYSSHPFAERSLYRVVRHPLMVGFLIAFWATPVMSVGHLVFALLTTAYVLFGIRIEERDLLAHLGEDYRE